MEEVALTLGYPDPKVKRTAIGTLARLGGPAAAAALAGFFPGAEPALQLDCLEAFTMLRSTEVVTVLGDSLQATRSSDLDTAKVRLRIVETLGLLGSADAIPALHEMFKKKGFLGGRESTGMRMAAAKALAAINTREARETMAIILDGEKEEEVRSVLRQFLVGGGAQ
jgi:HEAT repeat protein